jgi:hypothetical protein
MVVTKARGKFQAEVRVGSAGHFGSRDQYARINIYGHDDQLAAPPHRIGHKLAG